jgi:hypothetical protein
MPARCSVETDEIADTTVELDAPMGRSTISLGSGDESDCSGKAKVIGATHGAWAHTQSLGCRRW